MMRILYVFRALAIYGGIERILVDKMNYLADEYGYSVYMVTANQGMHPIPYKLSDNVVLKDLNIRFHDQYKYNGLRRLLDRYKRNLKFKRLLKKMIKQISPDVIICVADGYHVLITKVKGDIPLVVEAHNNCSYLYQGTNLIQKYFLWQQIKAFKNVQLVVTLTLKDADEWKRILKNVLVITNFVQLNKKCEYSKLNNKRVIFVGRLVAQKRVLELLNIWQEVYPKHKDWCLDIYGDGEEFSRIEALSSHLNMNVSVHKPSNDISRCYLESDFLVLTSEYEPFGLVIPEAMSCGLPVISYDVPYGPSSIISDGQDGFLIENNNRHVYAEKMSLLMDDNILLQKFGKAAISSSKRFTADLIMPQWKKMFEEIVK